MIESGGIAPYAPTAAVVGMIHAYRDRPIQTPITTEVIEKVGIASTIAPRTLQALKLLDLIDQAGEPTVALKDLRSAGSEEYRTRLAEVLHAAYSEVFIYRNPAEDEPEKVEEAFRTYKPVSMRDRMVRLFMGLCAEAGIISSVPRVPKVRVVGAAAAGKNTGSKKPAPVAKRAETHSPQSHAAPPPQHAPQGQRDAPAKFFGYGGAMAGADHLAIRGLLQTLPPVGSVFPDAKRKEWADAVVAAFALIYERNSKPAEKGNDDDA
jgi:hypothetical protein